MHNKNFALGIVDINNIENGLRVQLSILAARRLTLLSVNKITETETEMHSINETLGKLHNQKIFWNTAKSGRSVL